MNKKSIKICNECLKEKPLSDFFKCRIHNDGLQYKCKDCSNALHKKYYKDNQLKISKYNKVYLKNTSFWKRTFKAIRQRCIDINAQNYNYYGGRGIQCKITVDELKELWFRDKAYLMKKPSIDRIDNDGNYEYLNCRYIEMSKNIGKRNTENAKNK